MAECPLRRFPCLTEDLVLIATYFSELFGNPCDFVSFSLINTKFLDFRAP